MSDVLILPPPKLILPKLTYALAEECAMMLGAARERRQLWPDKNVPHHGRGCGCPSLVDNETGLFDPVAQRNDDFWDRKTTFSYDTDYPFFICARCKDLVPWCFGCAHDDPYLSACCDDCWSFLTAKGSLEVIPRVTAA